MLVRKLTPADASAWWHLRLEALEGEPLAFGKSAHEHRATTVESIRRRLETLPAGDAYWGAFTDGGALIGTAIYLRAASLKARHKGQVYGVYVTPSWRRRNVGRSLMSALIDEARREPELEQITLSVSTEQLAAQRLYESFGFTTWGIEPYSLKVGAHYIDERFMILRQASK